MAIRFHTLTIENFGPYKGRQSISLETSDEAPVVVIFGENTLGKTQLFSALRWCLYGTFQPHQTVASATSELPDRLNIPARLQGDAKLEVSVSFSASGRRYQMCRSARFFADGRRVSVKPDLRIDAVVIAEAEIDAEIGRVLHPQISEFFLFDAELLETFYERLATDRERALIRSSIETVLGIPGLQLAQRDAAELANDAATRQAKQIENRKLSEEITSRIRALESEAESIEADRKEVSEQLEIAEAEERTVRQQLKTFEGLQADMREIETLEVSIAGGEVDEAALVDEMRKLLSGGWRSLARVPLGQALAEVQARNSAVNQRNVEISTARTRVSVLEDRARGGACPTCGQPLPAPGPEVELELTAARASLQELLAETGGGTLDLNLERRIGAFIDEVTVPRYVEASRKLTHLHILQYERRQRCDQIRERMQGDSAPSIRVLASRAKALETAIGELRKSENKNARRAEALAREQTKLTRDLQRVAGAGGSRVAYEASFYRCVRDLLGATVEEFREDVRMRVQAAASRMFLQLIRDPSGYGGLRIGADYEIELLDTRGQPRQTSQGGKQLLALSLIGALKQAAVRGGPVVLDSPLGRLDLEHRENVLRTWIPALGGQAVLLVQSGELTKEAAQYGLGSLIGRMYQIVRPSNDPEIVVIEGAS